MTVILRQDEDLCHIIWVGNAMQSALETTVSLVRTSCRYGGERTWFECPQCGGRARRLYAPQVGADRHLACRRCHGLAYELQNGGVSDRMRGGLTTIRMDDLLGKVRQRVYRGKPTRRYLRYLELSERFERSIEAIGRRLWERSMRDGEPRLVLRNGRLRKMMPDDMLGEC